MFNQQNSCIQNKSLDIVHASVNLNHIKPFDRNLFDGFTSMRVFTHTSNIPAVMELIRDFEYKDFECIFGNISGLSRDKESVHIFSTMVTKMVNDGYRDVTNDKVRFYIAEDIVANIDIYLLQCDDKKRVVVGSANLCKTVSSIAQNETLIVFDDDDSTWEHYSSQYNVIKHEGTMSIPRIIL